MNVEILAGLEARRRLVREFPRYSSLVSADEYLGLVARPEFAREEEEEEMEGKEEGVEEGEGL